MNNDRNKLYDFIIERYSTEESVRELCFRLFVNYDDLPGRARKDKVRELIEYLEHKDRIKELHEQAARQHEDAYRGAFHVTFQAPLALVVMERNPRQVFISHAHQDSELAHRLAIDLERAGHPVWIAPESIRSGEDWVEAIGRGLDESAYFVVILTPAGIASRWVKREANLAAQMAVNEELTFIPLWREPCRVPTLWDYQRVPFDQKYETGLTALLARLGSKPVETFRRNSTISTSSPPDRRIHAKTGIELIRIPAGPFVYGSADSDTMAREDEKPQQTVSLPEYWIARTPITNAQYKRFLDSSPDYPVPFSSAERDKPYCWDETRRSFPRDKADHPVVLINWNDAKAYCDWAGLRLPSEVQWEKAARSIDGRMWPWGNEPATSEHCNFDGNVGGTSPVGQYSPNGDSPYGCVDMAGNVWEWTDSWYYLGRMPAIRGSSWRSNHLLTTRVAFRSHNDPLTRVNHGGFRVVEFFVKAEELNKEPQHLEIDATEEALSAITPTIDGHHERETGKVNDNGGRSQYEVVNDPARLAFLPDSHLATNSIIGATPKPHIRIHEKTGIELIRIPAGPFLYGSVDSDKLANDDEKPQRMVNLPEYWISHYPVTNAQYKCFLDANPDHRVPFVDDYYSKPYNWNEMQRSYPADKPDHPVVLVTWFDAKAFCDWAGLWLPSEEQWEKAARGTDGRIWPWNNEPPTAEHCNFRRNVGGTTPVGLYSLKANSPYGCADMAGNVWEWTASRRDNSERWRMLRGGSWGEESENCRCARRTWYPPDYPFLHFGFRVLDAQS